VLDAREGTGGGAFCGDRTPLFERAVRSMPVVVRDVGVEDSLEVPGSENEETIEAFASDGADPAFGVGIRDRRTHGDTQGFDMFATEDGVERGRELRVAVADQELHVASAELVDDVAGPVGLPRDRSGGR
jgi:hypothetical protein